MKISIIHNLYKRNPHVNESIQYNILALEEANIDYQYILFNDKGDKDIYDDIKDFINDKVEYHYSKINYGMGRCSGGWVGAIPLLKGDIVHNTGQDDVFIADFYKKVKEVFSNPEIMFFSCNGIRADEDLNQQGPMISPQYQPDYSKPLDRFKEWFGVIGNEITQTNNGMLAPGTLYRKEIHDIIGSPSLNEFFGVGDFEYWARMLFFEIKGYYESSPLWLYRISNHSISHSEKIENKDHRPPYLQKVKEKYTQLWKEKMQ